MARTHDGTETADATGAARVRHTITQPQLFIAFDANKPDVGPSRCSLAGVRTVAVGRGDTRRSERKQRGANWQLALELDDPQISREHAFIEKKGTSWVIRDLGSRNGTRVDGVRIESHTPVSLREGAVMTLGRTVLLHRREGAAGGPAVLHARDLNPPHPGLGTMSTALARDFDALVRLMVRTQPAVLVRGPTGSGKEIVARALHDLVAAGGRRGEFVAVNCGALPQTLVEAELFGARKGAFSGASEDRRGLVRAAHGGTLFLDEVGDLAPASQAALLRVLQEREVLALGDVKPVPVNLVVLAATHRDLEAMIERGSFREDLLGRLAGHQLVLPSLAERREDLGLLVARMLGESGAGVRFSADAAESLFLYDWPLNVRELKAALAQAVGLASDGVIRREHLPAPVASARVDPVGTAEPQAPGVRSARDAKIRRHLVELLHQHGGNLAAVARDMGKHRRQIHRWLKRFQIDPDEHRPV